MLLIVMVISFSSSCSESLYPNQYYDKGLRVRKKNETKWKKQIKQYDNCGLLKKNREKKK